MTKQETMRVAHHGSSSELCEALLWLLARV